MRTLNVWTGSNSGSQLGTVSQDLVTKRSSSRSRVKPTGGFPTAGEPFLKDPLGDVLYRAMGLDELRSDRVLRLKGEIAASRYNVSPSELADCLLHIARSDFN